MPGTAALLAVWGSAHGTAASPAAWARERGTAASQVGVVFNLLYTDFIRKDNQLGEM